MPARKSKIPPKTKAQVLQDAIYHLTAKLAGAHTNLNTWASVVAILENGGFYNNDTAQQARINKTITTAKLEQQRQLRIYDQIRARILVLFELEFAPLVEFQEGQWWVKELDDMAVTSEQMRAVAVVHNLLKKIPR